MWNIFRLQYSYLTLDNISSESFWLVSIKHAKTALCFPFYQITSSYVFRPKTWPTRNEEILYQNVIIFRNPYTFTLCRKKSLRANEQYRTRSHFISCSFSLLLLLLWLLLLFCLLFVSFAICVRVVVMFCFVSQISQNVLQRTLIQTLVIFFSAS